MYPNNRFGILLEVYKINWEDDKDPLILKITSKVRCEYLCSFIFKIFINMQKQFLKFI